MTTLEHMRRPIPVHKPTIYETLAEKLKCEPAHTETVEEVKQILREANDEKIVREKS
jgi:hypothetical protein